MRMTLGLLLWTVTTMAGVLPAEAGAQDRGSLQAARTDGAPAGDSKSQGRARAARLDSCRQKLAPSLDAKLGGLLETRNELRREYAEQRQSRLDSNQDMQKIETELRIKLGKLRQEKGGDDPKVRAEVEQLVRKSRVLKKSLTGTGELKSMAVQLQGMEATIRASASVVLSADAGCLEFKEALTREVSILGGLQGRGISGRGNPESTLK